jgi:hypothetical protein
MALAGLVFMVAGCSSVPEGQRVAAAQGFAVQGASVAVLDVHAEIGLLSAGDEYRFDQALSATASNALHVALVADLRDAGVTARQVVLEGQEMPVEAVLALEDLYEIVHNEGLSSNKADLTAGSPRFPEALADLVEADYALVTVASGAYSTGGRRLSQAAGAALAVGVGFGYVQAGGGQYAVVGLYDLDAGRLVWVHKDAFGQPSLRDTASAAEVADKLLAPLPIR